LGYGVTNLINVPAAENFVVQSIIEK
jgi:hypothetical protein